MQRVIQTIPRPSSNTYNVDSKRVYTRFNRKPQIYQTSFQANKTYKIQTTLEEENMNNFITNIYKQKKYQGFLDSTAPNNKNIFIETDSEPRKDINYEYVKSKYINRVASQFDLLFSGCIKSLGYLYDFRSDLHKFVVKQYGQWNEYYAPNKTLLRKNIYGRIEEIVKLR